jgi:hypothetical protein
MKKFVAFVLPLMFFSLMSTSMAATTPVKVKRVRNVCFIRVWGEHQTKLFLFHYDNLSPSRQILYAAFVPKSQIGIAIRVGIRAGDSMDFTLTGDYGMTMYFLIEVDGENILEGRIVIPPPRWMCARA